MLRRKLQLAGARTPFVLFAFLVLLISTSLVSLHGLSPIAAFADTTTWAKSYGGTSFETTHSVQQTLDGGYIAAGGTSSFGLGMWLLKLDSDGNIEWEKSYEAGVAESVQQTLDGGYIAAGATNSISAEGSGMWLLKLDSDGNIEWEKSYLSIIEGESSTSAHSVQQTLDGGYIAAGRTEFASGGMWLVKLDSDGNIEWEKSYGEGGASSVQQTLDGGYIAAGGTSSFGAGEFDMWLLKLDSDGNIEWEKAYGGTSFEAPFSVQQTLDGGYIVAGETTSFGGGFHNMWLLKLDSEGNIEWEKSYDETSFETALWVQQTLDGGYIVAGHMESFDAGLEMWLLKLDSEGNIEWEKAYGGTSHDIARSAQQTLDGGYIVAGETTSFGAGGNDIWLLKLDSDGNIDSCITDDLAKETSASVVNTTAAITDTTADVQDTSATVENTEAIVEETNAIIDVQCGPGVPPAFDYGLQLFENTNDLSDGVANLDQELRAVAVTDDSSVDQITFRWIHETPGGGQEVASEVTVPITAPEDTFAPDRPGDWIVEADFNNGQVVRKTVDVPFFVVPESPIGVIALLASSLAVLGLFVRLRKNGKAVLS